MATHSSTSYRGGSGRVVEHVHRLGGRQGLGERRVGAGGGRRGLVFLLGACAARERGTCRSRSWARSVRGRGVVGLARRGRPRASRWRGRGGPGSRRISASVTVGSAAGALRRDAGGAPPKVRIRSAASGRLSPRSTTRASRSRATPEEPARAPASTGSECVRRSSSSTSSGRVRMRARATPASSARAMRASRSRCSRSARFMGSAHLVARPGRSRKGPGVQAPAVDGHRPAFAARRRSRAQICALSSSRPAELLLVAQAGDEVHAQRARRRGRPRSRAGTSPPCGSTPPTVGRTPTFVTPPARSSHVPSGSSWSTRTAYTPSRRQHLRTGSRFAVGTPMVRPAPVRAPPPPRARAAARARASTSPRSPAAMASRARVLEKRPRASLAMAWTRTSKPSSAPSLRRRARSPERLAPKRKFSPTTTTFAPQRLRHELAREPLGLPARERRVEAPHVHGSTPSAPSSSARRSTVVRSGGAPCPTTAAGCGSKVSTLVREPGGARARPPRASTA